MTAKDDFGARMKQYEAVVCDHTLQADLPIYARIDGRSFSSFTRDAEKPFDAAIIASLIAATELLVEKTHAKIGYVQSDEISLVWHYDQPQAQALFGGKVHKLTSVLASLATAAFSAGLVNAYGHRDRIRGEVLVRRLPHFDCRVLNLPSRTETANMMLWRAMDCEKNAVSSACRAWYSSKAMHGLCRAEMLKMVNEKTRFADFTPHFRFGTWVIPQQIRRLLTKEELADIPAEHQQPDIEVTRTIYQPINIRSLTWSATASR